MDRLTNNYLLEITTCLEKKSKIQAENINCKYSPQNGINKLQIYVNLYFYEYNRRNGTEGEIIFMHWILLPYMYVYILYIFAPWNISINA